MSWRGGGMEPRLIRGERGESKDSRVRVDLPNGWARNGGGMSGRCLNLKGLGKEKEVDANILSNIATETMMKTTLSSNFENHFLNHCVRCSIMISLD